MEVTQKDMIVEQACRMFVKQGVKEVRMDDIAQAVRVSKRTLYEMFGDKEELLTQAIRLHLAEIQVKHLEIASAAPNVLIAVLSVLKSVLEHSDEEWKLKNAMSRFYPTVYKRIMADGAERQREGFRLALIAGKEQGLLVDRVNIDLSITMLYYMATGIYNNQYQMELPDGISPIDAFTEVLINFMRGISTAKGLEVIDDYVEKELKKY